MPLFFPGSRAVDQMLSVRSPNREEGVPAGGGQLGRDLTLQVEDIEIPAAVRSDGDGELLPVRREGQAVEGPSWSREPLRQS